MLSIKEHSLRDNLCMEEWAPYRHPESSLQSRESYIRHPLLRTVHHACALHCHIPYPMPHPGLLMM